MSTALQDAIRKTPPRTLTDQQPAGNVWSITNFANDDTQLTIGISRQGLPDTAPEPYIAPSVPVDLEVNVIDVATGLGEIETAYVTPTHPRFEVFVRHAVFADGGNFIIELPELPLVDFDNHSIGTVPAKSILLSNVRP